MVSVEEAVREAIDPDAGPVVLGDLADRAFGGSAAKLVLQALSGRKTNAEELSAIRELLDRLEGGVK